MSSNAPSTSTKNVNATKPAAERGKESVMSSVHASQKPVVRTLVVPVLGLSSSKKATKRTKAQRQAAMKSPALPDAKGLAERMAASLEAVGKIPAKVPAKSPEAKAADVAVKKAEDAIKRVALSKQPKVAAVIAEQKIEEAGKAVDAAIAASQRPAPRAGQIWSCPAKGGRTFFRVEEFRAKGTEDAYLNIVRVTDATGAKLLKKSKSSPFAGLVVKHKLPGKGDEMDQSFRYEGVVAGKAEKAKDPNAPTKAPREKVERVEKPKNAETPSEDQITGFISRFKRDNPEGLCSQARRAFNAHGYKVDGKPVFAGPARFRKLFNETKAAKS